MRGDSLPLLCLLKSNSPQLPDLILAFKSSFGNLLSGGDITLEYVFCSNEVLVKINTHTFAYKESSLSIRNYFFEITTLLPLSAVNYELNIRPSADAGRFSAIVVSAEEQFTTTPRSHSRAQKLSGQSSFLWCYYTRVRVLSNGLVSFAGITEHLLTTKDSED
ncbi:hypothetical protein CDAR_505011 [Caerostris darwini]|uniref:Uncharacterized protein n=1 Tax=Caerostris darwini TaxID=1538125 RepID=A0AAV4MS34_9ARAC|nr:hypothetical protein CDAR_505011 [Caerostris darwini]